MTKEYICRRISNPIRIDGLLEEREWAEIQSIRDFVSCIDADPNVEKTEAKISWDNERLYIAFKCYDSDIKSTFKNLSLIHI